MHVPLFELRSDAIIHEISESVSPGELIHHYPAFESTMGDTLVREVEDQADDDPDALWLRAVALQLLLDRVAGR